MKDDTNPLLDPEGLPPFTRIRPEHVQPAIDALLAHNRAAVARLLADGGPYTWQGLVEALEVLDDRLNRTWSPVSHLNAVMNTPELRAAYNACLPKLSEYATEMGQNQALFLAYKAVAEGGGHLDAPRRKLLSDALRDFHLSGIDLPAADQARFKEIGQELARLGSRFDEQVLDATQAWTRTFTDPAGLDGLPPAALEQARQTAEQRGEEGWMITLELPSYLAVITHAHDRALRREIYTAYATRASDQGPHAGRWDNGPIMEEILALRHEQARLLGFANYAERSLATKMAHDPDQVLGFLNDLAARSRPQAGRELEELTAFARSEGGPERLEAWDIAYYSERLRQARFHFAQEDLRPYFPAPRVIEGLFGVAQRLFGIRIHEVTGVDVWHPDVRFFEIHDEEGHLRGQFYLDLYARPHKRGGAWMDGCIDRFFTDTLDQIPAACLVCNFTPPLGDQPALLTHDEVETLFHEFGHGLHHLLTRVDHPPVAGINGVPWDAVELPSQLLENWAWERPALDLFAGHWETGAPLPDHLYRAMRAARNFQSAMQMVRQLEFALFDFRVHLEYEPARGGRIYEVLEQVRERVAVVRPPAFNRFAHAFSHIFSGGYAAGYYSYKWAEVLAADAFALFQERGIFDRETGRALAREILERGGSAEAMDLYRAFRGREPRVDALLQLSGIQG